MVIVIALVPFILGRGIKLDIFWCSKLCRAYLSLNDFGSDPWNILVLHCGCSIFVILSGLWLWEWGGNIVEFGLVYSRMVLVVGCPN